MTKNDIFESVYSGYIGLAPYDADIKNKEYNFLYQLKKKKLIDHMTFAFYVTLRDSQNGSHESSVKFGSYDKIGLQEGS